MKRGISNSDNFVPNKRRKIDPEVEKQLINELIKEINTDEKYSADEETLLSSNDETQLKQLIDRLPDLNHRFGYVKQTPLMIMIENGMTELAKYLIQEKKVDLAIQDDLRQTALHYACEHADEEIASIIIDIKKEDNDYLDALDVDGVTPVIYAAQNGCTETVFKLLDLNISWCFEDSEGDEFSVITEAADPELIKEFRTKYKWAYKNYVGDRDMQRQLVNKALEKGVDMLKEILSNMTDMTDNIDSDEDYGDSEDVWDEDVEPNHLQEAIVLGDEDIVRYLQEKYGWMKALGHVAVDTDNWSMVKTMHELGALVDGRKSTVAAVQAAIENENYDMLEFLLTEVGAATELKRCNTTLTLEAAVSVPESTSFARLLTKYNAQLPEDLRWWKNPFGQDFYDRYLRSHVFGPKIQWWSPEEAKFVRNFSQGKYSNDRADGATCHFAVCNNDVKRVIFGYFNCIEDISSVMLTCKDFNEIISSQEYWKAQWFATYELAVIDNSDEIDWQKIFIAVDSLLKRQQSWGRTALDWIMKGNRVARVCVLEGSYCYQVRTRAGTTEMKTISPSYSPNPENNFPICGLDEEINFNVEQSPLPMDRIKEFLPGGRIEFVDHSSLLK